MEKIVLNAAAKLNLSLDIKGRREDGYHLMEMVMQSISLYDTVTVEKAEKISVSSDRGDLPQDERNIAWKAAKVFFEAAEISGGAKIHIEKRIPSEAGMAGGSADGAAVFHGLNELYAAGFSTEELMELGLKVGADLPFCIRGGTALVEGIGEKVTSMAPLTGVTFAVAKPDFGISTAEAFLRYDSVGVARHPDTEGLLSCLKERKFSEMGLYCANVLEQAADDDRIAAIIRHYEEKGAFAARMTGSGSAVFGVFSDMAAAKAANEGLSCQTFEAFPMGLGVTAVYWE